MGEEMLSIVSNGGLCVKEEASDYNGSSYAIHATNHLRDDTYFSSAKFKGIVPQQNGHWGAQIYANHQRIWLGTFKSENEAAMAYDSAGLMLRSGDSHRNFPWTNLTIQEPNFQNLYTPEAVLNMIKDGSYPSKFAEFLSTQSRSRETECGLNLVRVQENRGFSCRQLFHKELTPSDVGKLNRLVIPKKYAIKYFPSISESAGQSVGEMELVFYDRLMRSWKFRYCYWRSSQSFVFTRGWNRFVRGNDLKSNDIITFCKCECRDGEAQTFCMIDISCDRRYSNGGMVEEGHKYGGMQAELRLGLGGEDAELQEEKPAVRVQPMVQNTAKNGFRLFGVQIY